MAAAPVPKEQATWYVRLRHQKRRQVERRLVATPWAKREHKIPLVISIESDVQQCAEQVSEVSGIKEQEAPQPQQEVASSLDSEIMAVLRSLDHASPLPHRRIATVAALLGLLHVILEPQQNFNCCRLSHRIQ